MNLFMTGIDFTKADIENRERFALTKAGQAEALKRIHSCPDVSGCVIINTCNRMELWISYDRLPVTPPFEMLCEIFGVDAGQHAAFFVNRQGGDAVRHLFELACGLKSMIFGEEQIISQVREAIVFARGCGASDALLHALFRYAVTSAKKVRTGVRLTAVDRSAAGTVVRMLKERFGCLKDIPCMVVGSGEIGRLAVKGLIAEGCRVTMTLRQFKSGDAVIPSGCETIHYEDRYELYPKVRVVISATRSPHYTLDCEKVEKLGGADEKVLFDLAVPRDIDPKIGRLENVTLYDIDHLGGSLVDENNDAAILKARAIINSEIKEFERWRSIRGLMPVLNEISSAAAADVNARINHHLKNAALDDVTRRIVNKAAGDAVSKVVEKILYTLQKNADATLFDSCLDGLDLPPEQAEEDGGTLPLRFPLYVDLSGREVVVIGAGAIARRRVSSLLSFPCHITAVAPEACEEIRRFDEEGRLCLKIKNYEKADIENAFLVVAATDDRELNHRIAVDAKEKGCYCSVADCKEECTFYFPAVVHYPGGVIGICGTGEDHGKTRAISSDIKEFIKAKEMI